MQSKHKKEDKVATIIADLKKHHDSYTTMQYKILAEMVSGDLHSSSADLPSTSMLTRAGRNCGNTGGGKKAAMTPLHLC